MEIIELIEAKEKGEKIIESCLSHQQLRAAKKYVDRYYEKYNVDAEVVPFIEDMVGAYMWADIVICRAGASTIFELAACGIASILIPFPFAVDEHQVKNAEYLVNNDAAILVEESELSTKKLKQILLDFFNTPELLIEMAIKARKLSKPNASNNVAKLCVEPSYA